MDAKLWHDLRGLAYGAGVVLESDLLTLAGCGVALWLLTLVAGL